MSKLNELTTITPTIDDYVPSLDASTSTALQKTTWQAIRDLFKTYFDTVYQALLVSGTNIKTVNGATLLGSGDISTTPSTIVWISSTTAQFNTALSDNDFATLAGTETLTNKTLIASTNVISENTTTASSATPAPTGGSLRNFFTVTALAAGATFSSPSETPANGNLLMIRIKDNGTARTLAWNAIYRAGNTALPTTTIISKTMYLLFAYNSADSKWDLLSVQDNL